MAENFSPEEKIRGAAKMGNDPIDIVSVALAFAAFDRPRVPLDRYVKSIATMAEAVGAHVRTLGDQASSVHRAESLGRAIAGDLGYEGDSATYDDLQNANLMRVIDRRKGLPVTLGFPLFWLHSATRPSPSRIWVRTP